jgi:hypothetical protein
MDLHSIGLRCADNAWMVVAMATRELLLVEWPGQPMVGAGADPMHRLLIGLGFLASVVTNPDDHFRSVRWKNARDCSVSATACWSSIDVLSRELCELDSAESVAMAAVSLNELLLNSGYGLIRQAGRWCSRATCCAKRKTEHACIRISTR